MKYKLTDETITYSGRTLHRIEALKDFGDVKAGDKGGYIEREDNLSQIGRCWVSGNAEVSGNARAYGNAKVFGNARVSGDAEVSGDASVSGAADYIVFKNWWSSGRYFTWTKSNNMWKVGCFYGTGKELIDKAYNDSATSGREYERIVKYVEEICKENKL